ncbi:DUF4347 domain-containing protein [Marinobacter lacisalsi]|uniref:DUF4347 domain-containing protein n=1 Tax=Marinobacter lacisalsi TaxID=475979 RepID=A0ABV8QMT7_9GAMM
MSNRFPHALEKFRRKPLITALEPRVLLDGAALATTMEMATDVDHQVSDSQATTESMVHFAAPAPTGGDASQRREIAFVDRGVEDSQALADGLGDNVEVIYLDADTNGLEQMVAALEGQQGIDAVHVLSHGDVGELKLGTLTLNGDNLSDHASTLETLGQSLSESGDVMLYGCYVGADDSGRHFIDAFAGLTGADVAASDDLTGAAALGGDWNLEVESGSIETSGAVVAEYSRTLAPLVVSNLSDLNYVEGDGTVLIDGDVAIGGSTDYTGGYIDFAIDSATTDESLGFQTDNAPSIVSGQISIVGSTVFRGDGTNSVVIGSVDATLNGQNGQPLRINFSNAFENGDFQDGTDGSTVIKGWTSVQQSVRLDGVDQIAGQNTPIDQTYTNENLTDAKNNNGGQPIYDDTSGGSFTKTATLSSYDATTADDLAIRMNTGESSISEGYGVIRGPYVYSDGTVSLQAGDSVSFDWKALSGGDAYDAYGYIIDVNTGDTITILDSTGSSSNQETNWANEVITIGQGDEGVYRFVFVAGSYDFTGGRLLGGELMIDDIQVTQANPPGSVGDSDITSISQRVTYTNTAVDHQTLTRNLTVSVRDKAGNTGADTSTINLSEQNNAPAFSGDASLTPVAEDTAAPSGDSVVNLFGALFSDVDTQYEPRDDLAGIVITGDASSASEGEWQYSTDGSTWYSVGAVSNDAGLLLSGSSSLRFAPAADYNGTPGSLSVHAVDSSNSAITFTNGLTRATFDTLATNATGGVSAVSAGSVSLDTSITPVNDAAAITSSPVTITHTDTATNDSFGVVNGTVTASDVHGSAPNENGTLSFSLLGGTVGNGESVLAGSYGSLTLNTLTGDYTWTPDSAVINSLPAGSRVTDSFTVQVSDGQGGLTDQTFTVNVDPANDTPTVTTPADINITETSGATIVGTIADTLQASDLDTGAALVFAIKSASGSLQSSNGQFGRLELDSGTGQYTFTPDLAALNALDSDTTETFTLEVSDGTDTVETALNINVTAAPDTAANYVEQGSAIPVLDDTAIDTDLSYGGGYIDFDLDSSQGTETLGLQRVAQADTTAGAVSIVDNAVYLGDGNAARVIGQVDSVRNGLDGQPLRINFSVDFVNGSFEDSSAGRVTSTLGEKVEITGWTVVNDRVTLGAEQHYDYVQDKWIDNTIAGLATPEDTTYPTGNLNRTQPDSGSIGSEATTDNGGTNPYAGGMQDFGNLDSQSYYSNIASGTVSNGGSGNSLQMGSRLNSEAGYEVIRGPYVHSTGTVSLEAGDEVAFSWKAEGGGDAYDVFGYIVNVEDASDYQVILDATGNSPRAQTAWARESVSADSAGEYRFVFVSGTFDATGGEVLGAQLYIDDVEVQQQNPAGNIGSDVLQALARQVTFADSSDLSAINGTDSRVLKVTTATGGDSPEVHTSEKAIAIGEVNDPVALDTPATIRYTDTAAIDSFVATSGQLKATDADAGTTFEFGLGGNDVTIENGLVTQTGAYGTLSVDSTTGEYTYTPDASKLNALVSDATDTFVVRVADGSGSSDEQTLTVELQAANDAPLLGGNASTPVFVENGAPVQVDAGITIADPEGLPFDGGSLTVSNTGGGESSDQLSVLALNGVSRDGAEVSVGGVVVGRIDSHYNGDNGKALRIDLNGNANALQVQALARAIAFSNDTDTVGESVRDFHIEVSDGGGAEKPLYSSRSAQVEVQAINDLPEITLSDNAYVVEKVVGTNPDGRMQLTGLQVSDADHDTLSVTLATSQYGSLTVLDNVPGGLAPAQISDNGSRSLTLTGTQAAINATLAASLVYEAGSGNDIVTPGADYLQVTARDAANGETLASKLVTVVPAVPNADSAARVAAEDAVISVNLRDLVADINDNAGYYELGTGTADQTDGNDQVMAPGSLSAFDPARLIYADHDIDGDGDIDASQAIGFRLDHGQLILGNDEVLEQVNGNWRIPGDALANLTYTPDADWSGTEQFVYQYTSGDGNRQSHIAEVAFYVTAVNDAPELEAPSAQTVNEDTPLVFSAAQGNGIGLADVDAQGGELALSLKVDRGTLSLSGEQGLTVLEGSNNSGQMTVKGTLADLQAALEGLTYTAMADYHGQDILAVTLDDLGGSGDGGAAFATDQVSLTVAPVNDAPQVGVVDASGSVQEDVATVTDNPNTVEVEGGSFLVDSGAITFSDVDVSDSSTVTWTLSDGGIRYSSGVEGTAAFEAALAGALKLSGDTRGQQFGTVNWQFALDNSLAQFLPENGSAEAEYTLTVTDSQGATASSTVTLTITGTNDAPALAADVANDIAEVAGDSSTQSLGDSGVVRFDDLDQTDVVDVSFVSNSDTAWKRSDGSLVEGLPTDLASTLVAGFSTGANGLPNTGQIDWSYEAANLDLDFLNAGDTLSFSYTVTAKDSQGASASEVVRVTVVGTNDAPEVARQFTREDSNVQKGADYRVDVGTLFTDKDSKLSGESLGYSVTGLPRGVVFDPSTNTISGKPSEAGVFTITVTAVDAEGATLSRTYGLTVTAVVDGDTPTTPGETNPPPAPDTTYQPVDVGSVASDGLPDGLVGQVESGDPADSSGFVSSEPVTERLESPDTDGELGEPVEESAESGARPGERVLLAEEGALVVQNQNPDGNTTTRASVDVNVGDDGQVVFTDVQREAFSTVSLSVASIGRTSDATIEIDIEDTSPNASAQQYSGSLAGGQSLPSWIQVDPSTGSVTIDNPPAGQSKVDIRVQAIGSDGQVRILELKLDLEELLRRQQMDAQPEAMVPDDVSAYRPLADQLEAELASRDNYGSRLVAMLGA